MVVIVSTIWYSFADLAGYSINNFDIQIDLNENGSAQIEESIEVNFFESRHGIYRDIPLWTQNDYIAIENIKSNKNIHNITIDNDQILRIQLGDPNISVMGNQMYTISYTVNNAIKTFSWNDEFYRNLIWGKRNTTIDRTTWTINLPKDYRSFTGSSFAVWWAYSETMTWWIIFEQTTPTQRRWYLNNQLQAWQWVTVWLQFFSGYFMLPTQYDEYFTNTITNNIYGSSSLSDQTVRDQIMRILWIFFINIIPILLWWAVIGSIVIKSIKNSPRKSKKPIITQYHPPQHIDPSYAFYLWYNNKHEPKIFTALLYHRATHGWVTIHKQKNTWITSWFGQDETYSIIETSINLEGTNIIDDILLQKFFWRYDTTIDTIPLSESSHGKISALISALDKEFNNQWFTQKKKGFLWNMGFKELTVQWSEVFEHLRGYKEYLSKVEQPVLESELKADPDFINKILPWAVLFGIETRLLKMVEDVLKQVTWYNSNDWTYLTYHTFNNMNKSFASFSVPPRSSGSSWFSWGGGFSWGGRGGGGWGSR